MGGYNKKPAEDAAQCPYQIPVDLSRGEPADEDELASCDEAIAQASAWFREKRLKELRETRSPDPEYTVRGPGIKVCKVFPFTKGSEGRII